MTWVLQTWVLEAAVAAGALALVALAVDRVAGPGCWPRLRHALWALVALRLVLPPGVASPLGLLPGTVSGPVSASTGAANVASLDGTGVALLAWAVVALGLATRALLRRRTLASWVRRCGRPAPAAARDSLRRWAERLGLRRVPRLVLLPGLESPAVVGLAAPVVLLPPSAAARGTLDHALLHELTHLRRGDLWAQAAFSAVALLAWFHPAAWLARSRARALREIGCDLAAARTLGARAVEYRRALLEEAAFRYLPLADVGAAGWGGGGALILARLAALESRPPAARAWQRAVGAAAILVLGALALPATPGCGASLAPAGPIEEARVHLARTMTERERFGCIHRMDAWLRLRALEDASASPARETP